MTKNVVVIGGGVGGLYCAADLQRQSKELGLKVILLEQHDKLGGFAQGWTRRCNLGYGKKGFCDFEITHAVSDFAPGQDTYEMYERCGVDWDEIGDFVPAPKFSNLRTEKERDFMEILNTFDENEHNLSLLYPHEHAGVRKYFNILRKMNEERSTVLRSDGWQKMLEERLGPKVEGNKLLGMMLYALTKPTIAWYHRHTFEKLLDACFKDDKIKTHLSQLFGYMGLPASKAPGLIMSLMHASYFRSGGAQAPSRNSYQVLHEELGEAFVRNGGEIRLLSQVEEIVVENGVVKGVRGRSRRGKKEEFKIDADCVVAGGDIKKLTQLVQLPEDYKKMIDDMTMSISFMSTHLVVEKDLTSMKRKLAYAANVLASSREALEIDKCGDFPKEYLIYASIPTLLRPEANLIRDSEGNPLDNYHIMDLVMMDPKSFGFWDTLRRENKGEYIRTKKKFGWHMVRIAERMLGIDGLEDHVRNMDVSTAKTYERYCLATNGACYGTEPTIGQSIPNRPDVRLPIKGLYGTGASFMTAGVTGSITSGEVTAAKIVEDIFK